MPSYFNTGRRRLPGILLTITLVTTALGLAACAPSNTNTTSSADEIGRTAQISYGTIVSMRGVVVQNPNTGAGTLGGAAPGGASGSFIGRNDVRGNILGAVSGAVVGGLAGTPVQTSGSKGQAVEFIIQEDNAAAPISVMQANELNFVPGERIMLTRGARTRIARGRT
jgi:outer membrane lipoprotein SlyB